MAGTKMKVADQHVLGEEAGQSGLGTGSTYIHTWIVGQ